MKKIVFLITLTLFVISSHILVAQSVITQWNFNSNPPDASTATGSTNPNNGTGTLTTIGGVTSSFASGTANGGSSDPATTDNSGFALTGFPTQGNNNKTAGIQIAVSTFGYTDIVLNFDLRHSSTSSRYVTLQYTTDITAPTPTWVDATTYDNSPGDTWFKNRTFNFAAITALNNNPNVGFRIVSSFNSTTSVYSPATSTSNYATTGTWRFDMVTLSGLTSGADLIPPIAQTFQTTSSTQSFVVFNEPLLLSTVTNLTHYSFSPSLGMISASLSATGDTVFLVHDPLVDGTSYTLTLQSIEDVAGNAMTTTSFTTLFNGLLPNLVITEIIHSPNDIEMIEVYNAGSNPIPLGGLSWAIGTTGSFPAITLAPGANVVFATSIATASATLGVSTVYLINSGLGSTNDNLVIRNSLNQTVDSVQYFVGSNGWPSAPSGVYGYSFELTNPASDNSLGTNWIATPNQILPQPSVGVVLSTAGVYPPPPIVGGNPALAFVGNRTSVAESVSSVTIQVTLTNANFFPSAVQLQLVSMGTATDAVDFTLPSSTTLNWPANSSNVSQSFTVNIQNDLLPENAEYFILKLINPTNANLPLSGSNHFTVFIQDDDIQAPAENDSIQLNYITSYSNGPSGINSAEIVAFDSVSKFLFIANSIGAKLDIVNFHNPASPTAVNSIAMSSYGNINSVAVHNGIVAVAIENANPQDNGKVVFFDYNGNYLSQVEVGAMPDMITFNQSGTLVMTANEGEPNTLYTNDPLGSVSIIDISGGVIGVTQAQVTTLDFTAYNSQLAALKASGIRIFGPNASVAQDLEPEYVSISPDDLKAYVTCQENNCIVTIDLVTKTITNISPLGVKNHELPNNSLDANDQTGVIQIANWPIKGNYQPDAIASYNVGNETYLITANEGDAREYTGYSEIVRLSSSSYVLDGTAFPEQAIIKANLGRLNVTTANGDTDNDGDFDEIHLFGGRSVSIWNANTGALVWDSGNDFELITSKHPLVSSIFNASNSNNTFKNRSDDKGPEPEGVTIATIHGRVYAFVALERIGGCMVYDITNPSSPSLVDYKNNRNVTTFGGDNGSEGIIYISPSQSPNGKGYVLLANEVSSTLSIYEVEVTNPHFAMLQTKAMLEGYYINNQTMTPVKLNQGVSTANYECDDVIIKLYSPANVSANAPGPYTADYTANGIALINGAISVNFPKTTINQQYWLSITHRNSIETWSASPITIVGNTFYDFTTAANKAYGSNQTEVEPGVWAIYSGDINQDGSIDALDYLVMDPDIINGSSGYLTTDLNGDGIVDAFDYLLLDPNIISGIGVMTP